MGLMISIHVLYLMLLTYFIVSLINLFTFYSVQGENFSKLESCHQLMVHILVVEDIPQIHEIIKHEKREITNTQ